jgi:hypothetical protein
VEPIGGKKWWQYFQQLVDLFDWLRFPAARNYFLSV